jgi:glycosyltransferase involved in cell wall biosynthesis
VTTILQSLRICLLFLGYGEGGLEKHVVELANGLAAHGHEVLLICDPRMSGKVVPGVRVLEVNVDRSRSNPLLLLGVYRAVTGFSPQVLHTHGRKAMQVAMRIRPVLHCPVVGTVHNSRSKRGDDLERLDRVVCVSKGVAAGLGLADTRVIYNGIPAPVSERVRRPRAAAKVASESLHLLAVGRLVGDKGFDVLLKAMTMLEGVELRIAGDGPERAKLERLVREYGLEGRVALLGHCSDVPALMAAADLLVISSRNEGFSYVFAEALMNHLPVVSTHVPIANELLSDELLCPVEDAAALAGRIRRIQAANPELLAQWFEPLFAFARCELTVDHMLHELEALYREVSLPA